MKCTICKQGETVPGYTTVTLQRGGSTLVIENVPARVCSNCEEAHVDEKTTRDLLTTAEQMATAGSLVNVSQYQAA